MAHLIKIKTMSQEDIRKAVKDAYSKKLFIVFALFNQSQRQEKVVLEVKDEYFVVCEFVRMHKPKIILFNQVREAICKLNNYKNRIIDGHHNYKINPEIQCELNLQLMMMGLEDNQKNTVFTRALLEHAKKSAIYSKDQQGFVMQ